ncbi:MAG: extracellular solute-binding protein [Candidatus Eremiobacterota bacterium]
MTRSAAALAAVVLLGSAASAEPRTQLMASSTKGAPGGPLVISVWYCLPAQEGAVFHSFLQEYDQNNPYIEIQARNFPNSAAYYRELTTGAGHPSLALMETSWLPAVAQRGNLMTVEQWMPKEQFLFNWSVKGNNYLPLWNAAQVNGQLMAMPMFFTTRVLIYNPEVLQKAGVKFTPATWEQVAQAAQKVTESGSGWGFSLAAEPSPQSLARNLQVMTWQSGGELATPVGLSRSLDGATRALTFLGDLALTRKSALADPVSGDGVAMLIGTPEDYLKLRQKGVAVRTAALPGPDKKTRTTEAQIWSLGMFGVDPVQLYKVRDVAFYMLDFQQQRRWAEQTPYLAAHVKVFDNPFYRQARLADHNNLRVFVNVLNSARVVDTSGSASITLDNVGRQIPLVMKGQKTVQEALK